MMPLAILFAIYFSEKEILFQRLAVGSVIIFTIIFFATIPVCEKNSGREAAKIISPLVDENSVVVSYRRKYSGSLVFYLGEKVFRLEDDAGIERLRPKEFSWTSLNVMPFMNVKNLPQDKKIIIFVDDEREKNLQNLSVGTWKFISEVGGGKIYVKE